MSDDGTDEQIWPTHCPTCGAELAHGTDFDASNEKHVELNPGEMVVVDYCPNPDCPAAKSG